jgi:hypothetical protein
VPSARWPFLETLVYARWLFRGEIRASRHAKGNMHNAHSGSSVVLQQGWGQSVPAKNCGPFPPLFTEVLGSRILGSPYKSQPILSRFSAHSHTSLLVILVIRARPDEEGDHIGAGTE